MPTSVRSGRALAAAERRRRVVELRRGRATFDEIGRELGISAQAAWKMYQRALQEIPSPAVEQHRQEELELLDAGVNDLLKLARDHARPRYAVEAWNCIVRISERRARLLGLDAPSRKSVEVIEAGTVEAEIARLEKELIAEGMPPEEVASMKASAKIRPVPREPSRAELDGG